jgi:hypothetical protein
MSQWRCRRDSVADMGLEVDEEKRREERRCAMYGLM